MLQGVTTCYFVKTFGVKCVFSAPVMTPNKSAKVHVAQILKKQKYTILNVNNSTLDKVGLLFVQTMAVVTNNLFVLQKTSLAFCY